MSDYLESILCPVCPLPRYEKQEVEYHPETDEEINDRIKREDWFDHYDPIDDKLF